MLLEYQESGSSRRHCGEEIEAILLGLHDPGKNKLSYSTSLEKARSSREDGILAVELMRVICRWCLQHKREQCQDFPKRTCRHTHRASLKI